MLIILGIWEEEDNIDINRYITCVIYEEIPRTRFTNRKDNASEVDSELSSELSLDDRGDAEILGTEVLEDYGKFFNDEDEGTFDIPPFKKGEVQDTGQIKAI